MQPVFPQTGVLDLLLNRDNSRHTSKDNQDEVIEYLLGNEEVYNLARHMSQNGINPLEVVAVFPDEDGNLVVAEGNRRVCAAQLLTDPEKAPASVRLRFKALAEKSRSVTQINAAIFNDYAAAQPWLQILHDGEQDGVGRRRWKPDQKARATTSKSTDALSVALLEYAEKHEIISGEVRRSIRVSTVTRYLANPAVRQAMRLASQTTSDRVEITTDEITFAHILASFFNGIESGKLHSRSVTVDWLAYASELERTLSAGQTSAAPVVVSAPVALPTQVPRTPARVTRAKLSSPDTRFIGRSAPIIAALNKLESNKLTSLYNSLISVRLDEHPALLTTGSWAFIETLTALHGRNPGTEFVGYINGKLGSWGVGRDEGRDCRLSLEYIAQHGNAQKHSAKFTAIDARNLNNHFIILQNVLLALVNECIVAKQGNS